MADKCYSWNEENFFGTAEEAVERALDDVTEFPSTVNI